MTTSLPAPAQGPLAVLHLSRDVAEWLERDEDGTLRYGSAIPASSGGPDPIADDDADGPALQLEGDERGRAVGPAELVAAALAARKQAGGRQRRCVLALDQEFAPDRTVQLPGDLKRSELKDILHRKALSTVQREDDSGHEPRVLYHAWADGGAAQRAGAEPQWHLVALDEAFALELGQLLRDRRLKVERVAALQLAPLALAAESARGSGKPVMYIVVHDDRMDVGLLLENNVLTRTRMEGNPSTNPAVANGLYHEVRSISGFWRKQSRGGEIEKVVLLGLNPEQAEHLQRPIGDVVPGAEILALPGAEGTDGQLAGRAAMLASAAVPGPLSPNLRVKLPPRRTLVGLAALLAAVLALALSSRLDDRLVDEAEQLTAENFSRTDESMQLQRAAARYRGVEDDVEQLRLIVERTARIGRHTPPLRPVLTESLASLPENVRFENMRLYDAGERDFRVELQGTVEGSSSRVLGGLRSIRDHLTASPFFDQVEVTVSDRLPERPGESQPFLVAARCRRRI